MLSEIKRGAKLRNAFHKERSYFQAPSMTRRWPVSRLSWSKAVRVAATRCFMSIPVRTSILR